MTRRIIPVCVLMIVMVSMILSACSSPKPPPTITVTPTLPPLPGSPTPLVTGITPPPPLPPSPTLLPTRTLAPLPTLPPTPAADAILGYHTVQSGETLFCIGRAYQVHPKAITKKNNLDNSDMLSIGQKLAIPNVPWSPVPSGEVCQRQF